MVFILQGEPDDQFLPAVRQPQFEDLTPTFGDYVRTSGEQTFSLNPTQQAKHLSRLADLDQRHATTFVNELGMEEVIPGGLDPSDPRARRLSLDEANEKGEPIGLRFSEPPTQGQFDYLADLKRSENERNAILAKSPSLGASATGLAIDLAASAIDPLNLAVGFVPIVGQARYARWAAQVGLTPARAAKGAVEGAVGTALITPVIYGQAQALQQQYDQYSAFADIVFGSVIGSGLHVAGGSLADRFRAARAAGLRRRLERIIDPRDVPQFDEILTPPDRRVYPSPAQEAPSIVQAMDADTRAGMQNAAVRAVATDKSPRVDTLLSSGLPELRPLQLVDQRFPATLVLRSDFTAADYATGTPGAQIMDEYARTLAGRESRIFSAIRDKLAKRYSKLNETNVVLHLDKPSFKDEVGGLLEHPDQAIVYDPATKKFHATGHPTPGAMLHEFNRALDDLYERKGMDAGGYRYAKDDLGGQTAHRTALRELYKVEPDRAPRSRHTPEEAIREFSDPEQPGLFREDSQAVSDRAWDTVQEGKDKDLDTLIADEEIGALDSIAANTDATVRDLGIMERVIPLEERQILEQAASRQGYAKVQSDLLKTLEEAVEEGDIDKALLEAQAVLKDPEALGTVLRGEKTLDEAIAEAGEKQPKPEPKPKEGEEPQTEAKPEAADEDLDASLEEIADKALKEIIAKRELADLESQIVRSEHAELDASKKTEDVVDRTEELEFNEAERTRSLREGDGAGKGSERPPSKQQREGRPLEEGLFATRTRGDGEAVRGAGPAIERERSSSRSDAEAPETVQSIGLGTIPRRIITPDGSVEVNVTPTIVELKDLEYASGKFQLRDRSRKESDAEIMEIARKLDPEQLMPQRVADAGAPIVIERDGKLMIISGNGRVKSLAKTYSYEPFYARSQAYRERLGPAADGYRAPVLVLKITDAMTDNELIEFGDRANRSRTAVMSSTERARRDAETAGVDIMMLYQGGEFTSADNRKFMNAFMRKVATPQEMGEMSKNGVLTKTGVDRLNAAVLASAYDDPNILSLMLESTDNNIKSIANAYRNVAPKIMRLRADIASGLVREEMDFTTYIIEAAHFIQKARDDGVKIKNALAQLDAFSQPHPTVLWLIRNFYDPNLSRAISALRITELLDNLVDIARQKRTGGFLEDTTGFEDVLKAAEGRPLYAPDEGPEPTLDAGDGGRGARDRGQVPEPAQPRPGERDGGDGAGGQVTEAPRPDALPAAPDFSPDAHPGRLKKSTLMREKKAALQDMNKELGLDTTGNKGDLVDRLLEDFKQKSRPAPMPEAARFEGLTDEQIDALPDPEPSTAGTVIAPVDDPTRGAFYDFLESTTPIKGAAHLARELGIAPDQAYRLLDEAVDAGWVNLREDGKYVRVPKARRPGRPDMDDEFADIIRFGARPGMTQREADLALDQQLADQLERLLDRSAEITSSEQQRQLNAQMNAIVRKRSEISMREDARQLALDDDPDFKRLARETGDIRNELRILGEQIRQATNDEDVFSQRRLNTLNAQRVQRQAELAEVEARLDQIMEEVLNRPVDTPNFADAPRGWGQADAGFDPETLNRQLQANLALQRAVGEALHRVPEVIRFEILDSMSKGDWSIAGMFSPMKRLIRLSREMGGRDARELTNHEIVHALRHLRLFTHFEWNIIRQAAEAANGIPEPRRSKYAEHYRSYAEYRDRIDFDEFVDDKLVEEWLATDHGEWASRRGKERETVMGRIHQRMDDFLKDLTTSFNRWMKKIKGLDVRGPESVDEIYRAIENGTIAKRWQQWGMGRADASNPLSAKSFAIDDLVDMTNRQLRELADEDSLSRAAKRNKALEALAPCAKHHL